MSNLFEVDKEMILNSDLSNSQVDSFMDIIADGCQETFCKNPEFDEYQKNICNMQSCI